MLYLDSNEHTYIMRVKKKPFALLEVLIALSLIAICATPLIQQPIANHLAEIAQMERAESGRIAACSFVEVKEELLKKQIRWKQIPALNKQSGPFSLPPVSLQLPPLVSRSIKRSFTLETLEEKQKKETTFRLVAIHFKIGKNTFTYRITLSKNEPVVI